MLFKFSKISRLLQKKKKKWMMVLTPMYSKTLPSSKIELMEAFPETLINSIIKKMKLRLIDYSQGRSSSDKKILITAKINELSNLLLLNTWTIEDIVFPWIEIKEKSDEFQNVFKYLISKKNDFRIYLENIINNGN